MQKPLIMPEAAEYAKEALKKTTWEELPVEEKAQYWFFKAIGELYEMEKSIEAWKEKNPTQFATYNKQKERIRILVESADYLNRLRDEIIILKKGKEDQ